MERYHIFKLGLAILFYAAYCIRPMLVNGLRYNDLAQNNNRPKQVLRPEDYDVYYQGVDGVPGVDFPVLSYIPRTTFSCREIESGYYADLDTDCQVFHICEEGKKISFLCPNGTVFDQSDLICEWWYKVNCTNSPNLYQESAEHLREDLAKRKASRRVSLDGLERNHGAVMRIEESSSVSAKQNGRQLDVSPSIKNIVTTNRVNGHSTGGNSDSSHSNRNSNIPPQRAINRINGNQDTQPKPKRYNDAQTGNYVNNVSQGPNKNLKEYHLQFSGTSPALDTASSENLQHVYSRSTTPSSVTKSLSAQGQTAYKKQSNGNRGSIKYNNNFGDVDSHSPGSTLKPSNKYDLEFPKHKSQITNGVAPQAIKLDLSNTNSVNKPKSKQQSTADLTKNDIVNRRLEPSDSDELQIPQETAAFVTNSQNSIQTSTRKHSTANLYPNHRTTYSDLKPLQSNFPTTKFSNGIKSVTPQYITTQSINNGKPFIGSTVGVNIYNSNSGKATPSTEASTRSSSSQSASLSGRVSPGLETSTRTSIGSNQNTFSSATIQPAVFISSISPLEEGSTRLAEIFSSTFRPSISSTGLPPFEGSTKRIVDHATVYGTFPKSTATTPLPLSGAEVKFTNGKDKVNIHLTKSVGGGAATASLPATNNFGQNTIQTTGSGLVSITVSGASPKIKTKAGEYRGTLTTSTAGGRSLRPRYQSTVAPKSETDSTRSGDYGFGTATPSVEVDLSHNGIGSTLIPDNVSNFQATTNTRAGFKSATTVGEVKNTGGTFTPSLTTDHVTEKSPLPVPERPGTLTGPSVESAISPVDSSKYSDTGHVPVLLIDGDDKDNTSSPILSSISLLENSQIVPEETVQTDTKSYVDGNKLISKTNSVLPSLLPTGSLSQDKDSFTVGSATTVRSGKNSDSMLRQSLTSTGSSLLPNYFQGTTGPSDTLFNSVTAANNAGSTPRPLITPTSPTLSNSQLNPEKDGLQPSEDKSQYGSTVIPPLLQSYAFTQTTTFSNAGDKLSIQSSTTTPTRATYLPKVNSTHRGLTTEANPLYSNSVILPPHLPSHSSANINDLDGTGAFFSIESNARPSNSNKVSNEINTSHNAIRSTLKPYSGTQSSFPNTDGIDHSNNVRTTQGFLTTANPIGGDRSTSSGSGFYVTKNSVYGPSTLSPLGFSVASNYKEPTPVVNVSPNSGDKDIQPPQITLSTPKFESSITLSKSETKWPRPFQKSPNSLDQQNEPVTPSYLNYQISSARPFKLPEGQATPVPTLPTPFTTAPTEVSSVYENVDNMINVLKEIVNAKNQDYSSETPRPGLVIPPSAGPQTLHTLAVYFANALDGIAEERERLTGEELDDESKEKLTSLLTQMTMYRYNELFKGKEAEKEAEAATTVATDDILEGEDSANPIEMPALRQLARNFSLALSSYLDDPEAFRRDLENFRPTEPPPLSEDVTEAGVGEEELLNFSDADSKSSFPPVFPTAPSVSPTWGYIIASKSQNDLDLSNSLNPDLNTADTQSFVPRYNNVAVNKKDFEKNPIKGNLDDKKDLPEDHWTTSPGVTKLWQSALSINPADLNEHFETTESIPHTTETDFSAPGTLSSLNIPQTEIQYDLRALPQLSLNSTQVHGILIDFMNTTKADESNRLQRLLKKLNTTEGEFLDRMKEIESNPLTKRLILLLISECGANATEDLNEHSVHNLSEEILKTSHSSSAVAANSEGKSLANSDIPTLVDPNLQEDNQDTRALQLLNSLYTIASKFGK